MHFTFLVKGHIRHFTFLVKGHLFIALGLYGFCSNFSFSCSASYYSAPFLEVLYERYYNVVY